MFSMLPVERSSTTSTVHPCSRRASDRCEPMKPAPPVISALDMLVPLMLFGHRWSKREDELDCPALDWVTALRLRGRRRGARIDSTDPPVGKELTLPTTPRTAPPSHLQRL